MADIAAGDLCSLELLCDRYLGRAYALAASMVGRSRAERVCAEVFANVSGSAAEFAGSEVSVESWLLGRVRTHALRDIRERSSKGQRVEFARRWMSQLNAQREAAGFLGESGNDHGTAVDKARRGLSDQEFAVIELSYFHGLTRNEIAIALDRPSSAISGLLSDAIKTIGRELSDLAEARRVFPPCDGIR